MDVWQFMDYISPQGKNMIADWRDRLLTRERTDFDSFIRILAKTREWNYLDFKWLVGRKYRGLGELRFTSERKEHRVIGFSSPIPRQFIMLIGCFHKGRIYTPANALNTAVQRKKFIEQGKGTICERKL